eukprot:COSAG01_NODE_4869_length_4666_cov_7.693891_1_plen_82_part_10
MGVCYDHRAMDKKWKGRINMLYLGHFTTEEECARVVAQAREKIARESYPQDFIRKGLIPRRNFEDFPRAFLLAFQVMTGDDW